MHALALIVISFSVLTALIVLVSAVAYFTIGGLLARKLAINYSSAIIFTVLWPLAGIVYTFTFLLLCWDWLRHRLNGGRCLCPPGTNPGRPTYEKDGIRCCTRCGHVRPESA